LDPQDPSVLLEYLDILNLLNPGVNMIRGIQVNYSTPGVYRYPEPTKPRSKHEHGYTGKLQYSGSIHRYPEPTKPRRNMIRGLQVNYSTPGVYIDILNLLNLGVNMVTGVQVNSSTPVPYNHMGENMIGMVTCSTPWGSYTNKTCT